MRLVVAPDKFKGSLDALAVADALCGGWRETDPDADLVAIPMADGGEGTVDAFLAGGAARRAARVAGPLGAPVEAVYARDGVTAVIEMAAASGLTLLGETPAPRTATTRGTGELVRDALDHGARRIVLAIGGSATTDGGAGALAALGAQFFDVAGAALEPLPAALARVARVDLAALDPRLREVDLAIACDVDNPLTGPHGAASVYGPQKGAGPDDIAFLDAVLVRLADALAAATGRDLRDLPGAGAAGGLGFGLAAAAGARLSEGVRLVAETRGLRAALAGADVCLTGEGRIDRQTLRGKVVHGVAAFAHEAGVPTIAFAGNLDLEAERALRARGVVCVPIAPGPQALGAAMARAPAQLRAAAARTAALWRGRYVDGLGAGADAERKRT